MIRRNLSRRDFIKRAALSVTGAGALAPGRGVGGKTLTYQAVIGGEGLRCVLDRATGVLLRMVDRSGKAPIDWINEPIRLTLVNEITGETLIPQSISPFQPPDTSSAFAQYEKHVVVSQRWQITRSGLACDLEFTCGDNQRSGYDLAIEFPILKPGYRVFTPTERGVVSVVDNPDYQSTRYGQPGWSDHRYFVLPLVSVMDEKADRALTIAIPPDENFPDLQLEWQAGRRLRFRLGHRAMGGGRPNRLRVLFYAHPTDYRSAIKCYSDDYPDYFRPALPRGKFEGGFYYHHIMDHPAWDEMARQNVHFIWTSWWYTYMGDFMPGPDRNYTWPGDYIEAMHEWYPNLYAVKGFGYGGENGKMMSDSVIESFIGRLHPHKIGTFAYFNLVEFGGAGGKFGFQQPLLDQRQAMLRKRFADALIRDVNGHPMGGWWGANLFNCNPRNSMFPVYREQLRRYFSRLPHLDGIVIDRLDFATSVMDYGHSDGLTMLGNRKAEYMVNAIKYGVQEVCRQAHAAGKRVYVNQFWSVDLLQKVDGYCHEMDYTRGLGYLAPYRPVSAWNVMRPYTGDLLLFEAQLKLRLQSAVFPHMIAHTFDICQQAPSPRAADMLEVYAPLFRAMMGKEQVLAPHCIEVSGANDANLFINGDGRYVIPVTSRTRSIVRGGGPKERVMVTINLQSARGVRWAQVYSADGPDYRARVNRTPAGARIEIGNHETASMVVAGRETEPSLPQPDSETDSARKRVRAMPRPAFNASTENEKGFSITIWGQNGGTSPGPTTAYLNEVLLGELKDGLNHFTLASDAVESHREALMLSLKTGDEGTWFIVERVDLMEKSGDGTIRSVGRWTSDSGAVGGYSVGNLELKLS